MSRQNKTALIGLIVMGASAAIEKEFHRSVPDDVLITTTRVPFGEISYQGLMEVIKKIPEAAGLLMEARPEMIIIPNMLGGCICGNEIVNSLQLVTGVPVLMPPFELLRMLRQLQAKRITLVSAFSSELQLVERMFFENMDFQVTQVVSLPGDVETNPYMISDINYEEMKKCLAEVDLTGTDAVFFDHPMMNLSHETGSALEKVIPVPFFSATQTLIYSALRRIGADTRHLYCSKFFD